MTEDKSRLITVIQIPIDSIEANPDQPRKVFDDMEELADSIKKN